MIIKKMMWQRLSVMVLGILIGFLLLFAFIDLLNELPDVKPNGYTFATALWVIALGSPTYFYEVAPIATLIGAIVVFAQMAGNNEYTVLRAAGYSMRNAIMTLMRFGIVAVILTFSVGELLAPYSFELSQKVRFTDQGSVYSGRFFSGVWLKDKQADGRSRILNIARVEVVDEISGITIYNLDAKARLTSVLYAKKGHYLGNNEWRLSDLASSEFVLGLNPEQSTERVLSRTLSQQVIRTDITPDILTSLFVEPDRMSMLRLYETAQHLEKSGQVDTRFQISLYKRLMYPLSIFVMLLLALPFAYLHARSGGLGVKIFIGILLGVVFLNTNAFFSHLGILNNWQPFLTALAPSMIFMLGSLLALYWVERH